VKQVVQSYKTGRIALDEMPVPAVSPVGVLVQTVRSAVSPGTERMIVDLAKKSLLGKARARPDLVRRVLDKARSEGLAATFQKVQSKIETPIPLGYSCAGIVREVGAFVEGLRVGDRVACGGAGYANHAEFNHVPMNLCARVPDGVSWEEASLSTIGAIALQGVRQADLRLGERVVVIGLGLIGQLTAQLAKASGCAVLGSDIDAAKLALAKELGADAVCGGDELVAAAEAFTRGHGADAVIIAASDMSNRLVDVAGQVARQKGRVVVVGLVGMDLPRDVYYKKELDVRLSMSYGPGRYDPLYEEGGIDYPFAFVRWTEGRNIEAFLDLLAAGSLKVSPLITHRIPLPGILDAYEMLLSGSQPYLGVVVEYPDAKADARPEARIELRAPALAGAVRLGVIGAGNFARGTLLPRLAKQGGVVFDTVCTQTGMSARATAERFGFAASTTDPQSVFNDPKINAVLVATRHDLHAPMVLSALAARKHVFTEKPLCLTAEELGEIVSAVRDVAAKGDGAPVVMVGFNRRFAPATIRLRDLFAKRGNPLVLAYRVNAGYVPLDHWTQDPRIGGGRIVGEVCHFVDALRFVVGAPITRVQAEAIAPATDHVKSSDNVAATLRFADGSVATIVYSALGDSSLPKERLEVFAERKVAVLDDYRDLTLHAGGRATRLIHGKQDKGIDAEMTAFVEAATGRRAIDFSEIAEVTRATLAITESLRTGRAIDVEA
jgi:polar amino acid transport system substrate-binding protein